MGWGNSNWGNQWNGGSRSAHAHRNGWGSSGHNSSHGHGGHQWCPEGQHLASCSVRAAHIWGGKSHEYHEHCPGCRHERAGGKFGSQNGGKGVVMLLSLFGGGGAMKLARKSLWD